MQNRIRLSLTPFLVMKERVEVLGCLCVCLLAFLAEYVSPHFPFGRGELRFYERRS